MKHCCFSGCNILTCGHCIREWCSCAYLPPKPTTPPPTIQNRAKPQIPRVDIYQARVGPLIYESEEQRIRRLSNDHSTSLEEQVNQKWGRGMFDWTIGKVRNNEKDLWFWYCGDGENKQWKHSGLANTINEALQAMIDLP